MIAKHLISTRIPPLKTSDTGVRALSWMHDFHVSHLAIVNNAQFLGLITEEDVLNFNDPNEPIGAHSLSLHRPTVSFNAHLYEVMKLAVELKLSIIPVVDADGNYMGVITLDTILQQFSNTHSIQSQGSIVVLETTKRDFVLSEIARIIESEGSIILSAYITSNIDSNKLELTLKLNTHEIGHIIASLRRFGYEIAASYQESDYLDNLKERYDMLMNYLNV